MCSTVASRATSASSTEAHGPFASSCCAALSASLGGTHSAGSNSTARSTSSGRRAVISTVSRPPKLCPIQVAGSVTVSSTSST